MRDVDRDPDICWVNCLSSRRYKVSPTAALKPIRKQNKSRAIKRVECDGEIYNQTATAVGKLVFTLFYPASFS